MGTKGRARCRRWCPHICSQELLLGTWSAKAGRRCSNRAPGRGLYMATRVITKDAPSGPLTLPCPVPTRDIQMGAKKVVGTVMRGAIDFVPGAAAGLDSHLDGGGNRTLLDLFCTPPSSPSRPALLSRHAQARSGAPNRDRIVPGNTRCDGLHRWDHR